MRALLHISRKVFHELVVVCVHGPRRDPDSSSVADASSITDPIGFANPAAVDRAGGVPMTGGKEMTTDTVNEPVSGYDSLKTSK